MLHLPRPLDYFVMQKNRIHSQVLLPKNIFGAFFGDFAPSPNRICQMSHFFKGFINDMQ